MEQQQDDLQPYQSVGHRRRTCRGEPTTVKSFVLLGNVQSPFISSTIGHNQFYNALRYNGFLQRRVAVVDVP